MTNGIHWLSDKKFYGRRWIKQNISGYLFILPAMIMYAIFFIYPFIRTFYFSLTDWNGINPIKNFIGLDNYIDMVKDPLMWKSLYHNFIWVIVSTIISVGVGLIIAVLIWSGKTKGRLFFRSAYFLPVVLSPVVVGIIWGWIYNPIFGVLNRFLEIVGLGFLKTAWLANPNSAIFMLLFTNFWWYVGFVVAVIMAGLQGVDIALYDAARCDGANSLQELIHITIPQLNRVLTMIILFTMILGFRVFDLVWITTRGGPGTSTELIATYTYKQSFMMHSVGYGSALSIALMFLCLIASFIFIRLREKGE